MPQLDKFSFTAQLIWFFGMFFLLFLLMSKTFLPTLGFTLKLRNRLYHALAKSTTTTGVDITAGYKEQVVLITSALAVIVDDLMKLEEQISDKVELYAYASSDVKVVAEAYKAEIVDLCLRQELLKND